MEGQEFTLPVGVFDSTGQRRRAVRIQPWKAKVKRLLGQLTERDAGKATQVILQETIVSVDGFEKVSTALLNDMTSADRDFCALQARILTRGTTVKAEFKCRLCSHREKEMPLDISKIEVHMVDSCKEIKQSEEHDARGKPTGRMIWTFEFDLPNKQKAKFRLPTGLDMVEAGKVIVKNPVEGDWLLWSRTCLEWGTAPPPYPSSFWDNLSSMELEVLEEKFSSVLGQVGPQTQNQVVCPGCGEENEVSIFATDFLLKPPRSRSKSSSEE